MPNWTPIAAALVAGVTAIVGGAFFIGQLNGQLNSLDGRVDKLDDQEGEARGAIGFVKDEAIKDIESLQEAAVEGLRSQRAEAIEDIESLQKTAVEDLRSQRTDALNELRSAVQVAFPVMDTLHEGPFNWQQGQGAHQMLHTSEGICFLTRVTGRFEGGGEVVRVSVNSEGYWMLGGDSMQAGVAGEARCWRFPPRPSVE